MSETKLFDGENFEPYFPIKRPQIHGLYRLASSKIWFSNEIKYVSDKADLKTLSTKYPNDWKNIMDMIRQILCFFSQMDVLVMNNIMENFMKETSRIKESKAFYSFQMFIEQVHNEVYSLLIEVFVPDKEEQKIFFDALNNFDVIRKIGLWVNELMNPENPLLERILGFVCLEYGLFNILFPLIHNLKHNGLFVEGLGKANEWIARDEGYHAKHGIMIFFAMMNECGLAISNERIYQILKEASALSDELAENLLKQPVLGMSSKDLKQYSHCVFNSIATDLKIPKLYEARLPFPWMMALGLLNQSNFFENKETSYERGLEKKDVAFDDNF